MRLPEPIVDRADGTDPEHEALLADSVGLALLVVLETLPPAERLAFVLHDMFAVPFDEIAPIVDRSPEATRQLASRARRRVQGERAVPDADLDEQREVVEAFLAAARDGDFDRLARGARPRRGAARRHGRRARARAARRPRRARPWPGRRSATAPGPRDAPGAGQRRRRHAGHPQDGEPFRVGGMTVRGGRIVTMEFLADPERLARMDLLALADR